MITAFRALTLATPPLTPAPQNALREPCFPACPPRNPCSYPRNSHPSSRPRPKSPSRYTSSSSVVRLAPVSFGLGGRGYLQLRSRAGKAPLYTSFLAHLLTSDHPILVYTCRLCNNTQFMHSVWQCYDALATDGDTSSASKRMCHHPPHIRWPSSAYVPPCSVSLHRCTVWVYL